MLNKHTKLKDHQSGVISLLVTILIMLLLTLIVLAMSQNASHERRQALDRQLSDQAFYNAESGINDTVKYLDENKDDPLVPMEHLDDCDFKDDLDNAGNIDGVDGVNKYTCILYDRNPLTLVYDDIGTSDSRNIPIEVTGGLGSMEISWDAAGEDNDVSGCNLVTTSLPQGLPPGCDPGGVKIDIITPGGSRDELQQNMRTAFLLPSNAEVPVFFPGIFPDNQGLIGQARCDPSPALTDTARRCSITITGLPGGNFVMHMKSIYAANDINIDGTDVTGAPAPFNNAQIMVDSTGKANDVLRRVQVRLPAKSEYRQAEFGIQSRDSICKLLDVSVGSVSPYGPNCPIVP